MDPRGLRIDLDNDSVCIILDIYREGSAFRRDFHHVTNCDYLFLFLYEGKRDRTHLAILVLDCDLAGPHVRIRVLCELELQFTTLQRSYRYEVDP